MRHARQQAHGSEIVISESTIDRRIFLVSIGLLGIGASTINGTGLLVAPAKAAAPAEVEAFRSLSSFLTGAPDLDQNLADRALSQLIALDSDFPNKAARLAEAVKSANASNMDAFLASPAATDASLHETMKTIVSAWYLGFTGTPIPLRAKDNTGFVTLTQARMYEPTIDATVRPTYVRGHPGYWIDPPPFVKARDGPPGLRSWGRESPQGIGAIPGVPSVAVSEGRATSDKPDEDK